MKHDPAKDRGRRDLERERQDSQPSSELRGGNIEQHLDVLWQAKRLAKARVPQHTSFTSILLGA